MIVGLFPELEAIGGVQLASRQTAAALVSIAQERGWPCRFLSLNDPAGEHSLRVGSADFSFLGFHRAKAKFVLASLQLARLNPHIIIAAHPNLALPVWLMRKLSTSTRTAVMTHGIEVWKPLPWFRRWALRDVDLVLAPSTDTARRVATVQRIAEARIRHVPWSLDPDFLTLVEDREKSTLPAGFPEGRIILTVGRWAASERYKGVDRLIQAMPILLEAVPDLHLIAVGEGDDLLRLQRIAAAEKVEGRIHFLRGLSRAELVACYASCDIFALPSSGEGFGFVFLEAMALGKPVVGTYLGGVIDLVEEGATGFLIPPREIERLPAALIRLLTDEHLRREMGDRARESIHAKYLFVRFREELRQNLCL
jgi:phosphatidyl-myo-inositol dimannoside synthase